MAQQISQDSRNIKNVTDADENVDFQKNLKQHANLGDIQKAIDHTGRVIETFRSKTKDFEDAKTECQNAVKNDFTNIRKAIDERESTLNEMIDVIFDEKCKKLNETINELQTKMVKLEKTLMICSDSTGNKQKMIDTINDALNKNYINGAKTMDTTLPQNTKFSKIEFDNSNNNSLMNEINNYGMITGDLTSLDAPFINELTQIDNKTIKVSWKITEKSKKFMEKECKDDNEKNGFEFQLLPMINSNNDNNNNANLIILKTMEFDSDVTQCNVSLNNNNFQNKMNDNLEFKCQMRIVNKTLNVQSPWSDSKTIKYDPK